MYALFIAHLARLTRCNIFSPDYRLAPEFPYPAATQDILTVMRELIQDGVPHGRLFLAGDSGGGGLVGSVLNDCVLEGIALPDAVVLFSPEVSLDLNEPSVSENAALDILPWNVPTNPYLRGVNPEDPAVSLLHQDLSLWPPVFLAYGEDETPGVPLSWWWCLSRTRSPQRAGWRRLGAGPFGRPGPVRDLHGSGRARAGH